MPKKLKSPLRRYGGKGRMVATLLPFIPNHKTYVEVFAGSAALFFEKPVSDIEVVNDLDSGLVNFFKVVRDEEKLQRLAKLLELTPYSLEQFELYRDTWRQAVDDVHKAHRWFITVRMSFGAIGKYFSRSITEGTEGVGKCVRSYLSAIDRLPDIHKRLRGVQIDHADFREILTRYDRANTFFYLDPPYVHSTRKTTKDYDHEMSDDDHADLVELLLRAKGKVMLSAYANPIYEPLEKSGWERHDFEVNLNLIACSQPNGTAKRRETRIESVWVNC
jgi:DNA adenine methylase